MRSLLESTGAEAADKLTKALAKYAERAYKASGGKVLGVTPSKSKYTGLELDVKLTVCEMTCAFALDPRDKVLFLYRFVLMCCYTLYRNECLLICVC